MEWMTVITTVVACIFGSGVVSALVTHFLGARKSEKEKLREAYAAWFAAFDEDMMNVLYLDAHKESFEDLESMEDAGVQGDYGSFWKSFEPKAELRRESLRKLLAATARVLLLEKKEAAGGAVLAATNELHIPTDYPGSDAKWPNRDRASEYATALSVMVMPTRARLAFLTGESEQILAKLDKPKS